LKHKLGKDHYLVKIEALLDWPRLRSMTITAMGRSKFGPRGYDLELMLRALLLGQFHSLSDPELEQSLKFRLDFAWFVGIDVFGSVPDETTHCRFRNALIKADFFDALLAEVNRQLEMQGIKVKQAQAAIIDATLIQSAARSKRKPYFIAEDRDEADLEPNDKTSQTSRLQGSDLKDNSEANHSADPDAAWIKKGNKSAYGYKGFARCDEEGFVEKTLARPANEGEAPHFETMIEGAKAKRIAADKAYASKKNRALLKQAGHRDGILHKAARGRALRASEKRFNKLISEGRYRIEQCFGTAKRLFGLARARYFGRAKVGAQMAATAICMNLLKAANMITLTP